MAKPMMKGADLYCWKNPQGEWNYSLLRGTNREKSEAIFRIPSHTMTSVEEVKKKLSLLAEGEYISWGRNYSLPPDDVQKTIREMCKELKLTLN